MKYFVLLSLMLALACSVHKLPVPREQEVVQAAKRFPNVTLAELNKGKLLFEQNCHKCHSYHKPNEHTELEWMNIIPLMCSRAKLDNVSQSYILKYVIAFSKQSDRKP
jgi:hypothetical protein